MSNIGKIGRRACDAAMEAADKMESLFAAIERLGDDGADSVTMSGIGRAIAAELAARMDRDETTLTRLDLSSAEPLSTS
jgi:hypothetical protein